VPILAIPAFSFWEVRLMGFFKSIVKVAKTASAVAIGGVVAGPAGAAVGFAATQPKLTGKILSPIKNLIPAATGALTDNPALFASGLAGLGESPGGARSPNVIYYGGGGSREGYAPLQPSQPFSMTSVLAVSGLLLAGIVLFKVMK